MVLVYYIVFNKPNLCWTLSGYNSINSKLLETLCGFKAIITEGNKVLFRNPTWSPTHRSPPSQPLKFWDPMFEQLCTG